MLIAQDRTPCWSSLSLDPERPGTIVIGIHPDLAPAMRESPEILRLNSALMRDSSFASDPDCDWGYGGALKRISANPKGFMSFLVEPPAAKIFDSKPCPSCRGTGRDNEAGIDCLNCDDGYCFSMGWDSIRPLSASLQALCALFLPYIVGTKTTDCARNQLLCFDIFTDHMLMAITAAFSPSLVKFMSRRQGRISAAETAMWEIWNRILPERRDPDYLKRRMRVEVASMDGWLNISCPGDGCGLFPNQSSFRGLDAGYEASDHNIDHPGQQFAILAALAAIETLARNELEH